MAVLAPNDPFFTQYDTFLRQQNRLGNAGTIQHLLSNPSSPNSVDALIQQLTYLNELFGQQSPFAPELNRIVATLQKQSAAGNKTLAELGDFNQLMAGNAAAPGSRSFQDIVSAISPGADLNLGGLSAQEMESYLNLAGDPDFAAGNILRTQGIDPNSGNPMARFMQGLLPDLYRQHDIYNAFVGTTPPSRAGQAPGAEALAANLGGVLGTFQGGGSSRYTPQSGKEFITDLNTLMNQEAVDAQGNPTRNANQELLKEAMTDPGAAWQTFMDAIGGGMSPALRTNSIQNRTFNRLQDAYKNQGTAGGGRSWLDFLTQMLPA